LIPLLFNSCTVTAGVFALRLTSLLETLELKAYDALTYFSQYDALDERFLIIKVDDNDLKFQKEKYKYKGLSILSDPALKDLLKKLTTKYSPRVTGLDIYRTDSPDTNVEGLENLIVDTKNLITVCSHKSVGTQNPNPGQHPPPNVPNDRISFVNVIEDNFADDIVRRLWMVAGELAQSESPCRQQESEQLEAFSLVLALRYLAEEKKGKPQILYTPPDSKGGELSINNVIFERLGYFAGGYQNINAEGYETLFRYRNVESDPQKIANIVSLKTFLTGIPADQVNGKIVLIGGQTETQPDKWKTPLGDVPGIVLHAHMVSYILDVAEGKRPEIRVLSVQYDFLWTWGWGLFGASIGFFLYHHRTTLPSLRKWTLNTLAFLVCTGLIGLWISCWVLLQSAGIWIPFVPPTLSYSLSLIITPIRLWRNSKPK
jgi:CHASE2 domain-containing sensor protein